MTVKKAGLPGQSGQNALPHVDLAPSSADAPVMSPATPAEALPFKPELAPWANVTTAVCAVPLLAFAVSPLI